MFKFPAQFAAPVADEFLTGPTACATMAAPSDPLVCLVQSTDPFDELARLINGGSDAPSEAAASAVAPQATPPAAQAAPAMQQAVRPVADADASAEAAGPVLDLSALRAAFATNEPATQEPDLAAQMRGIADSARQPFETPPLEAPSPDPLAQFEQQLATMLAMDEPQPEAAPAAPEQRRAPEPMPTEQIVARAAAPLEPAPVQSAPIRLASAEPRLVEARTIAPSPVETAVPSPVQAAPRTPARAPVSFDATAFAAPRVPETEAPLVVGQAVPGLEDLEQALGNELEAALQADLASSFTSPPDARARAETGKRDEHEAMGIPAALMAAAADREMVPDAVDRLHEPVVPIRADRPARPSEGRHRTLAASIAAIAIFGATAAVTWTLIGSDGDGEVPIILASTDAVKVKPVDAGGVTIPNQDAALFREGENRQAKPHQVALKRGSEAPVDVAKVRPVRINTSVEKNEVMKARRVRTVVVKPDGSIVTADAGSDPQVVGSVPPRVRTVTVTPAPAIEALDAEPRVAEVTASAPEPEVAPPIAKAAVRPAPVAQAPEPVVVAKAQPTPAAPAAQSAPAVPQVSTHDGYVVQISSRRSEESARKTFSTLQRKFARVLGSREAEYLRKDIEGKGTFYRVRVLAESKKDAARLCSRLKKAGGACFVSR